MKTLGILGGVGPQTTSKVYLDIINQIKKKGEQKYPPILIYNLPFPFIIEDEAIVKGINSEKMIPYLIEGAKILEKAGADFGILPCNTLHKYINEIRNAVKIPFLSILEETATFLKNRKVTKVGILATQTTVDSKIYDKHLTSKGTELLYPTKSDQEIINNIILEILQIGEKNSQKRKLENVCKRLAKNGAEIILLACTDLQLIASDTKIPLPIIDSTEILINSSVLNITK
jgi:aspartate racemase